MSMLKNFHSSSLTANNYYSSRKIIVRFIFAVWLIRKNIITANNTQTMVLTICVYLYASIDISCHQFLSSRTEWHRKDIGFLVTKGFESLQKLKYTKENMKEIFKDKCYSWSFYVDNSHVQVHIHVGNS